MFCSIKFYSLGKTFVSVTITDLLWEMRYLPMGQNENIAISAGGYFD